MGEHFDQVNDNYTLYGVERIGVASGYKYFGKVDWYAEGADRLVKSQQPDGSWVSAEPGAGPLPGHRLRAAVPEPGQRAGHAEQAGLPRGRRRAADAAGKPAAVPRRRRAKAEAAAEVPWDQRPRDAANLAKFAGHKTEGFLNWQIVNLGLPVDDWHDAPILYLAATSR